MGGGDRASLAGTAQGWPEQISALTGSPQPMKRPNGKFMEANSRAVNMHYRSKCLQTSFGAGFDINIPDELPGNPGCESRLLSAPLEILLCQDPPGKGGGSHTPCPGRGCSGICCIPEPGNQWLSSITLALVCVQRGKSFLRKM